MLNMGGSFGYLNKYSEVIYDGDKLTVLGTLTYNKISDRFELKDPYCLIAPDYIGNDFLEEIKSSSSSKRLAGLLIMLAGAGMIFVGLKIARDLARKYARHPRNLYRRALT